MRTHLTLCLVFIYTILLLSVGCVTKDKLHRCLHGIALEGTAGTVEGEGNAEFAWSPNGSRILFRVSRQTVLLIDMRAFPQDISFAELQLLTQSQAFDVAWSPLGDQIAYATRDDGVSIFLYHLAEEQITPLANAKQDANPIWSPNGEQIAFQRAQKLFVLSPDGTKLRQITQEAVSDISWSSDGQKLIFLSLDGPDDIYVVNADGSNRRQLTATEFCESQPVWSPNGEKIAYLAAPQDRGDIFVMNSDGTGKRNLTNGEDINVGQFSWSPDATKIAYIGNTGSRLEGYTQEVYLINESGNERRQLTNTVTEDESLPRWSPDGQHLAFLAYDGHEWHLDIVIPETDERIRVASMSQDDP